MSGYSHPSSAYAVVVIGVEPASVAHVKPTEKIAGRIKLIAVLGNDVCLHTKGKDGILPPFLGEVYLISLHIVHPLHPDGYRRKFDGNFLKRNHRGGLRQGTLCAGGCRRS